MSLPETDGGKVFIENKTVSVGDPTYALEDHDALAGNTDWLKEAKTSGWRGVCDDTAMTSNKTGTANIFIANFVAGDTSKILHDVSAVPIITDYRNRYIWISGEIRAFDDTADDGADFMPGGSDDDFIGTNTFRFRIDKLGMFTGAGQAAYDTGAYCKAFTWNGATNTTVADYKWYGCDALLPGSVARSCAIYFWVDSTSGDLMFRAQRGTLSSDYDFAYFFMVEVGPQWVDNA